MNKMNLSAYQPIADIQDNIVFANNGNVVLCYKGNLPEIYSFLKRTLTIYTVPGFRL